MSEEFGPNFITVTDEDGNDIELELLYYRYGALWQTFFNEIGRAHV